MGLFFFWLFGCVVVGLFGTDKTMGFWGGFLWGLFLSPVIGLIIVLLSKDKATALKEQAYLAKQAKTLKQIRDKPTATISVADELVKLKQLMDEGVITEDEFTSQKSKLLNQ